MWWLQNVIYENFWEKSCKFMTLKSHNIAIIIFLVALQHFCLTWKEKKTFLTNIYNITMM